LGYAGDLTGAAAIVYQVLINAGATPEYARQVAMLGGPRTQQILSHLSEGQIFQLLGFDVSPQALVQNLEFSAGGGIFGAIIGGVLGLLGGPFAELTVPLGASIGAGAGILAGAAASQSLRAARALDQRPQPPSRQVNPRSSAGILSEAGQLLRQYGPQIGQAVQNLIQPGPGPDGAPSPGFTPQGVPILDQTTDCPTCGSGPAPQAAEESPGYDLANQPGGSPTLQPPPPQYQSTGEYPMAPAFTNQRPALEESRALGYQDGYNGRVFNPDDNESAYRTGYYQGESDAENRAERQPNQPGDNPGNVPLLLNQPGQQPLSIPQQIQILRAQLGQEIQVEQQQLINQRGQHDLLQKIADKVNELKNLEAKPADQRDIPNELAQKRQLMHDLDRIQNGQPMLELPQPQQPGQPPVAPELPPQGPQPQIQRLPAQPQNGGQPQIGHGQPVQPVQFCVGCQSQEDAILFLNGEPSACSVVPGSTQTM